MAKVGAFFVESALAYQYNCSQRLMNYVRYNVSLRQEWM